jgi:hypothetical protein
MPTRTLQRVIAAIPASDGAGVKLKRSLGQSNGARLDPFLMLDHFSTDDPNDYIAGFPAHPHRGFETVTYVLDGAMEHKDSQGNRGRIDAGDVQWMTAGSGVIHSEMPAAEILRDGGRLHGFQLWVNLPRRDKMMKPRYQELRAAEIPTATSADGKVVVTVVAGESLGVHARIDTRTPIVYLHVRLAAGARFTQPIAKSYNAFAFLIGGEATFGDRVARENDAVIFGRDGDEVTIASDKGAELLLIAGEPLDEPVVRYGPLS